MVVAIPQVLRPLRSIFASTFFPTISPVAIIEDMVSTITTTITIDSRATGII